MPDTKPKILIYEDNEDLCGIYQGYIESYITDIDYDLFIFSEYADFIKHKNEYFDIVIVDWQLDFYDGVVKTAKNVLDDIDYGEAYIISGYVGIDVALAEYALRNAIPLIKKGGDGSRGIEWLNFVKDALEGYGK